jgi:hypothetical protein
VSDHIPKADRPETVRQAQTWETVKNRYVAAGLCHKCASQAAWGHQIGFSRVEHAPCAACRPIVDGLPAASSNASWRRLVNPAHPA